MNVRVRIHFKPPTDADRRAMETLAIDLTDNQASVRISADAVPDWLRADFTMPTEAQYKALPKIERAIRIHASNKCDSTIGFPRSTP
jgi:hypothetical protein